MQPCPNILAVLRRYYDDMKRRCFLCSALHDAAESGNLEVLERLVHILTAPAEEIDPQARAVTSLCMHHGFLQTYRRMVSWTRPYRGLSTRCASHITAYNYGDALVSCEVLCGHMGRKTAQILWYSWQCSVPDRWPWTSMDVMTTAALPSTWPS